MRILNFTECLIIVGDALGNVKLWFLGPSSDKGTLLQLLKRRRKYSSFCTHKQLDLKNMPRFNY